MPAAAKVVVAMSGGVDSSVAAALLRRLGHEVIGVFLRLGTPEGVSSAGSCDSRRQGCCSVLDADDARRVAAVLDIPLYVMNFQEDFGRVIDYFVSEYNRGRTPNPCVRCNDWLKFGKLLAYAEAVGADHVATGHYARIGEDPAGGGRCLLRGLDHRKDQSYVLFGVKQRSLPRILLPIGELDKPRVRAIARELKLPVSEKPDSQEICFVPDQDYAALVARRAPQAVRPGQFITSAGEVVGEHAGHQHFTIGQRKGTGVALGHPVYVVGIDPAANRVTLGERDQLLKRTLVARQINLLSARCAGARDMPCAARIRYNHAPQPCRLTIVGEDELAVEFNEPQLAITPGQAVVLYDGDVVLGGGWIERAGS